MNYIHKHITRLVFLLILTLGTFIGKGQSCTAGIHLPLYKADSTGLDFEITMEGSNFYLNSSTIGFGGDYCTLYSNPTFVLDSDLIGKYSASILSYTCAGLAQWGVVSLNLIGSPIMLTSTNVRIGKIHFSSVTGNINDSIWFVIRNDSSTVITSTGCSSFALTITGWSKRSPLPVKLTSFNGKLETDEVKLNWSTATETNNDYFEVERSLDGKSFTKIGFVKGAGNSVNVQKYIYIDISAENEVLYYRLKQVDYDGTFSYSNIVVVKQNISSVKLYPNPFENYVTVYGHGDIVITDILGKIYFSDTVGNVQTTDWPTGVYLVQYLINGEVKKIIKN